MIKSALVYESIRLSLVEILNPSTGFTTTTNWYSDDARDNAFVEEDEDLLLINTTTKFIVTFVTGSNMEVEIVVNETESILLLCSGIVNNFYASYLYYKADNYNISSTAKNALSRASSEYQLVVVVKPVVIE
jgi:hypothetical protein